MDQSSREVASIGLSELTQIMIELEMGGSSASVDLAWYGVEIGKLQPVTQLCVIENADGNLPSA